MGFDVKVHIMLFNSFEFLIYLPVVFLLYWLVFKHTEFIPCYCQLYFLRMVGDFIFVFDSIHYLV